VILAIAVQCRSTRKGRPADTNENTYEVKILVTKNIERGTSEEENIVGLGIRDSRDISKMSSRYTLTIYLNINYLSILCHFTSSGHLHEPSELATKLIKQLKKS